MRFKRGDFPNTLRCLLFEKGVEKKGLKSFAKCVSFFLWQASVSVGAETVVNDVSRLNPIQVSLILRPTTTAQMKQAIQSHPGPLSIGGGRFSMGGQTATERAVQIDIRSFNKILNLDTAHRTITVQPGIRWRDIQRVIDRHGLAVQIMQTYANFTVGGSLSVHAHGRYVGRGPIIHSVESIKLILADGIEVSASRKHNSPLFFAAIGGLRWDRPHY